MSKVKTIIIVAQFKNIPYEDNVSLDYPQNLPIPRIGETLLFNEYNGRVIDVRYGIQGNFSNISIIVDSHYIEPADYPKK
jgi:hypothetical protein